MFPSRLTDLVSGPIAGKAPAVNLSCSVYPGGVPKDILNSSTAGGREPIALTENTSPEIGDGFLEGLHGLAFPGRGPRVSGTRLRSSKGRKGLTLGRAKTRLSGEGKEIPAER
jgi:hypothetical protein